MDSLLSRDIQRQDQHQYEHQRFFVPSSSNALALALALPPHPFSSSSSSSSSPASSSSPSPSSSLHWKRRRRLAAAQMDCCRTCRLRKVKCGGNPGIGPCSNCSRLELSCSFVSSHDAFAVGSLARTTPSHSHTEAGTLRKRAQRACSQCHTHKTKCSGDLPKCKRCETYRLICEYTPARRKFANVRAGSPTAEGRTSMALRPADSSSATTTSTSTSSNAPSASPDMPHAPAPPFLDMSALMAGSSLIRKDIMLTHFDAYMRHYYWMPCLGFLHPESTYQAIQENRLPPARAAAICAMCSFFVNPSQAGREFGRRYIMMVESYIYSRMSKFSQDVLILLGLSALFHLIDRSFAKVWQCFGMASRLMMGLQLNWDVLPQDSSFIEQESLRRVAWHLFFIDRLLAGGYEEYISCRAENMKMRLPCNELAYRENRPVTAERLHERPGRFTNTIGLHGVQIRLVDLRHRIQVVTKRLAAPHGGNSLNLESSKVMADITSLQTELTRLHASIPDDLRLSEQSISRYAQSEEWSGFVWFHTHMSASYSDLYAFSLPGFRDPAAIEILKKLPREFLAMSQKQAVAHAICLARFFNAINEESAKMPKKRPLNLVGDFTVTYMTTQCIQVLLIAMQYNLYHDLEGDHTAPQFREGPLDEAKIRGLISTMLEISEPWNLCLDATKEVYESSRIAVEYFDKTRRAVDRSHPDMVPMRKDFKTLNDISISDWWLDASAAPTPSATGQGPTLLQPTTLVDDDGKFDVGMEEFGPPGLPHFLAQARGTPFYIFDFAEGQGVAIDGKTSWGAPEEVQMEGVGTGESFSSSCAPGQSGGTYF